MSEERAKNEEVAAVLLEQGDAVTVPRPVQHWAYFSSDAGRARFCTFLQKQSFVEIEHGISPVETGSQFSVTFWHTTPVDPDTMTDVTEALSVVASACGGEYDGWETAPAQ